MKTFFFYDLETTGLSPKFDRLMQFAGVRTDENFNATSEPVNLLIRVNDDILPSPEAILTTKITPQKTVQDGLSEAEFAKFFMDEIVIPDTIFVGYNNVRFDDEFMRNFRDPYEWQWKDGRSRWDLLDVVRLTRALRPGGINWPVVEKKSRSDLAFARLARDDERVSEETRNDGLDERRESNGSTSVTQIPINNLESLARDNGFENKNAHDALSDVQALIGLAKLLKSKQPKMFDYLFKMRDKKEVQKLVNLENPAPFIYASGRYAVEFDKTTVALPIAPSPKSGSVLVWDLRFSPNDFAELSESEILAKITADYETRHADDFIPLPVKELAFNKCPAVAPFGTLDESAQERLKLDPTQIEKNFNALRKNRGLIDKIVAVWSKKNEVYEKRNSETSKSATKNSLQNYRAWDVEGKLYDSFTPNEDRVKIRVVAEAKINDLADFHPNFIDERLPELLLRFKARNFPKSLSDDEKTTYEKWRSAKIATDLPEFIKKLMWLTAIGRSETVAQLSDNEQKLFKNLRERYADTTIDEFLLQELQLWAESIATFDE